jgi:hypothetical protein
LYRQTITLLPSSSRGSYEENTARFLASHPVALVLRNSIGKGGYGQNYNLRWRANAAIEITDPHVLALSNVWFGQFLDASRTPESEPTKGPSPYEVSFFVKLAENNVRKMYVAYYYPNSPEKQGLIYLPGEGAVWRLNASTILREGRDGKWNYASPAWESSIKPVLIRALALASRPQPVSN